VFGVFNGWGCASSDTGTTPLDTSQNPGYSD
jgi:hypothetical protein